MCNSCGKYFYVKIQSLPLVYIMGCILGVYGLRICFVGFWLWLFRPSFPRFPVQFMPLVPQGAVCFPLRMPQVKCYFGRDGGRERRTRMGRVFGRASEGLRREYVFLTLICYWDRRRSRVWCAGKSNERKGSFTGMAASFLAFHGPGFHEPPLII